MLGKNIGDTYSFGVVMWSEVNKKREFCILGTRFFIIAACKLCYVRAPILDSQVDILADVNPARLNKYTVLQYYISTNLIVPPIKFL